MVGEQVVRGRFADGAADEAGRVPLPLVAGEAALAPLSVGARSGGRFAPLQLVPQGAPAQVIQLLPAPMTTASSTESREAFSARASSALRR